MRAKIAIGCVVVLILCLILFKWGCVQPNKTGELTKENADLKRKLDDAERRTRTGGSGNKTKPAVAKKRSLGWYAFQAPLKGVKTFLNTPRDMLPDGTPSPFKDNYKQANEYKLFAWVFDERNRCVVMIAPDGHIKDARPLCKSVGSTPAMSVAYFTLPKYTKKVDDKDVEVIVEEPVWMYVGYGESHLTYLDFERDPPEEFLAFMAKHAHLR